VIVREALISDPRVLPADASAREAAELLTHPHVRSVLVADGQLLVGCITPEDVVRAVADGLDPVATRARDLATEMATISPDTPLEEAVHLMAERDLERLAVVDGGKLLGVLPRSPVLRRLAEDEPAPPEDEEPVA
jgi:CBS domain-containing protein